VTDSRIELSSADGLTRLSGRSGSDGSFALAGIPPGKYALLIDREGFKPLSDQDVMIEPEGLLFAQASLALQKESAGPGSSIVWADLSDDTSRTLIDAFQVQSLPSANNIW